MSSVRSLALGVGMTLVFVGGARADLHGAESVPGPSGALVPAVRHFAEPSVPVADSVGIAIAPMPGGLVTGTPGAGILTGSVARTLIPEPASMDAGETLRELPGLPGSAAMFLSAMMSLACAGLVCSARDANLGSLPGWYHTGGPTQVGHATPFPLEVGFMGVVACVLDTPCGIVPRYSWPTDSDACLRLAVRHVTPGDAPRGPPFRST